jgi:hypothetical protein
MHTEQRLSYATPLHMPTLPDHGKLVVTVSFESEDEGSEAWIDPEADPAPPRGNRLGALALGVIGLAVVAFAGWSAVSVRQESAAHLQTASAVLDDQAARRARTEGEAADRKVMAAYRAAAGEVRDVQDDLAWLSRNKTDPAPVARLSWVAGRMEVVGPWPRSPFRPGDRSVVPSAAPQAPGLHTYTVGSRPSPVSPRPVIAGPVSAGQGVVGRTLVQTDR